MSTLSFNPESGLKGSRAVEAAMAEVRLDVERPLSLMVLPAMPAELRGAVARGLDSAVGNIQNSRSAIAQAASAVKRQAHDFGAIDRVDAKISPWYKLGDALVWAAEVTGTDVIYKVVGGFDLGEMSFEASNASAGERVGAAFNFASNFFPAAKLPAITRTIGVGAAKGLKVTRPASEVVGTAPVAIPRPIGVGGASGAKVTRPHSEMIGTGHLATPKFPFWFGGGMDAAQNSGNALQSAGRLTSRSPVRGVPWQQNPALQGHFLNQEAGSQRLAQAARVRGFGVKPGQAVLHSGVGGGDSAARWAGANGGTTLEMTGVGKSLVGKTLYPDQVKWRMPAWRSSYEWRVMSTQFAREAAGSVRTVVGENIRKKSVFVTDELPALMANKKVTDVTIGRPDRLGVGPIATFTVSRTSSPISSKTIKRRLRDHPDGFRLVFK